MEGAEEEWRPLPGFEGLYEASDQGRIRSLSRHLLLADAFRMRWRRVEGTVLRPGRRRSGHLVVNLAGRGQHYVHRLVALAFHGPPPFEGAEVRHLNGDPSDNRAGNLSYGSRSRNTQDRKWHRLQPGRLSPERAREIKIAILLGVGDAEVARIHGVTPSTVRSIRLGRTHADVREFDEPSW